jgi:hypothetical protein
MLFGLPAAGTRQGETYWVRPCCQIYVSKLDFETLGHKVLEWAPLACAADKALLWLRKVRPELAAMGEHEEEDDEPAEDSVVAVPIFAHSMGNSTKPAGLEGLQMATATMADPRRLPQVLPWRHPASSWRHPSELLASPQRSLGVTPASS